MPRRSFALTFAVVASILSVQNASATAQRTFVASTGNDANPCTLSLPCRGFVQAITQTTPGGEVIVLDSAAYGPVTINQSVSIIAPPGVYAGISVFSGVGVAVQVSSSDIVTLKGLSITGLGGATGTRSLPTAR